jgi:hypothetical protein
VNSLYLPVDTSSASLRGFYENGDSVVDPVRKLMCIGLGITVALRVGLVFAGTAFVTGIPVCAWPNKDSCDEKGDSRGLQELSPWETTLCNSTSNGIFCGKDFTGISG